MQATAVCMLPWASVSGNCAVEAWSMMSNYILSMATSISSWNLPRYCNLMLTMKETWLLILSKALSSLSVRMGCLIMILYAMMFTGLFGRCKMDVETSVYATISSDWKTARIRHPYVSMAWALWSCRMKVRLLFGQAILMHPVLMIALPMLSCSLVSVAPVINLLSLIHVTMSL